MKIIPIILLFLLLITNGNFRMNNIYKNEQSTEKPIFCVLKHSPGKNWKEGIPFQEQPGVEEHVKYMSMQLKNGFLLMGGPFLDNSGGMMVCKTANLNKAKEIAEADPAVVAGLLKVEVKQWMIPMSSIELFPTQEK